MLKSVEDINTTKKRLRIEIPSDVIEKEILSSVEKLRQRVKIPGFRPGKAPVNLIEKRFGKEIEAEVLEKIVPEYFTMAIREADLKPIDMPFLDEEVDFQRKSPLNLSFTIEVLPKIENLTYENIAVKDIPVTVDEPDIEETLKKLQDKKALFEVAEKEIEMDDLVIFDYVESELVSGETFPSLKEIVSRMGNEVFPPDIMERVIGKKKGDIIEFQHAFDEAHKAREIAGKTLNIKVAIKEVKKKRLPEINDDFAKDLGYENLEELREKLKENIYKIKKNYAEKIQKAQIVNKLIEQHNFGIPESMLKKEIDTLMFEGNIPKTGAKGENTDTDSEIMDTIKETSGQEEKKENVEEMQTRIHEKAFRNVQAAIILQLIGQKEGVTVNDDEVEERISAIAQRLSATPETIKKLYLYREGSLESLRNSIREDKVLDLLLSKADIEKEEKT
jgi:trigger factor